MDHEKNEHCRELLSSLSDYLNGELEQELCAKIERHMSGCENCRIVVDTLRKTIYLYKVNAEPPEVPETVRERLYRRLDLDDLLLK